MNKLIKISIIVTITLFNMNYVRSQLPSTDPAFQLVWSDDFSGTQLNSNNWALRFPWGQNSNYEPSCDTAIHVPMAGLNVNYTDTSNCKVSNGLLKLTTRKVNNYVGSCWTWPSCPPNNVCNVPGYPCTNGSCWHVANENFKFTTAMLYSKVMFRYGYFEIKFKLPPLPPSPKTYVGHGGTFWLYNGGDTISPNVPTYYSEIDIFEINAYNPTTSVYYADPNSHFQHTSTSKMYSDPYSFPNFSPNTWYTAGVNWTSNSMEFYLNGVLQYTSYNHPDSLEPMPIIINLGGDYTPALNYCEAFDTIDANGTYFPYSIEIDYVKVWQLKKDCNTNISLTSYNPATYSNELHKSVTMGTNISITNQNYQSFWASDYILMNGVTYINNSNVLFDVTNCIHIDPKKSYKIKPPPQSWLDKINHKY